MPEVQGGKDGFVALVPAVGEPYPPALDLPDVQKVPAISSLHITSSPVPDEPFWGDDGAPFVVPIPCWPLGAAIWAAAGPANASKKNVAASLVMPGLAVPFPSLRE